MIPHMVLLEPLSECFVLGAMASWAISFLTQIDPFAIYLFHILLWFLLDYSLLLIIQVMLLCLLHRISFTLFVFLHTEIRADIQQD